MTSGQQAFFLVVLGAATFGAAFGWFSGKSRSLRENEFNRDLRGQLDENRGVFEREMAQRQADFKRDREELLAREKYVQSMRDSFAIGYTSGRKWLAKFVAESERAFDEYIAHQLRHKKRPAAKAAEEVSLARAEKRRVTERLKFLEYEIASLKEYFPFIEEYEDIILDEAVPLVGGQGGVDALDEADPVLRFLPKAEYDRLPPATRNQIALDRYLNGALPPWAIGRLYERYLGFLYESEGWEVDYHGVLKGLEDLGRDLICKRGEEVHIVQAKCWSEKKLIHEKHIFQLFGTVQLYQMNARSEELFDPAVTPVFITTTSLSPVARQAADWLEVQVQEQKPLSKAFPMIKCNINRDTKARIYHLPFDQQYDRTRIIPKLGEKYVATVVEAEAAGFRRAFRFSGSSNG